MLNDLKLNGADLTVNFDANHFNDLKASDVKVGSELPTANAVKVDNEEGTIRIAASSLSDIRQGTGIAKESVLASISFDFYEVALSTINKNADGRLVTNPLSFSISANTNETVVSRYCNDGRNFDNGEILSLKDLGKGIIVEGKCHTL